MVLCFARMQSENGKEQVSRVETKATAIARNDGTKQRGFICFALFYALCRSNSMSALFKIWLEYC